MITISPTDNYKAIQDIAGKTWPETYGAILSSEQIQYMFSMMYDLEALKNQSSAHHHFIIAAENGNFLGFASYELNYPSQGSTKVHKIYILPETQGNGIGKKMIFYILDKAKTNNQKYLSLNVNRFNEAIHFYTKIGFEKVGEENIDIGNGFLMEDFIMQKNITY